MPRVGGVHESGGSRGCAGDGVQSRCVSMGPHQSASGASPAAQPPHPPTRCHGLSLRRPTGIDQYLSHHLEHKLVVSNQAVTNPGEAACQRGGEAQTLESNVL